MKGPAAAVLWLASLGSAIATNELHERQQSELASSDPFYPSPWMDPNAEGWEDAYAQAKAIVSQMTIMEKVNLTTGVGWEGGLCVGNTGSVPRLGIRSLCMQDSPLGVRFADWVSAFPSGQTTAATWSRDLMYRRGLAMGQEHKGKGVDVQLGPVAGPLGRSPEGGRNWEGFSVDPVLTGVGMAETIKGIQSVGVVATAKHFIGNEQEHFRQEPEAVGYGFNITESISSNIDDKTLHELYVWPFADAVRAGVGSVMCSYNQINNSYACQNSKMLNNILKGELGFQGFVMSDWSAQHTGVAGAVAGLDMCMPGDTAFDTGDAYWGSNLTIAVLNETMPLYRLDDMALRIMAALYKVGFTLDEPGPNFSSWTRETYQNAYYYAQEGWQQVNQHVDVRGEHAAVIREIGAKGTVLLKNSGVLPLDKPKFVAVIGEDAGPALYGPNGCAAGDHGCDNGTLAMGWGSGTSDFPYLVTPDSAVQQQVLSYGGRYESVLDNYATSQIETLVRQAGSTAIVFINADSGEGYINVDGNMGDRNNLTNWNAGDDLVKNVSAINNNTIVVIHSVGPTLLTDWYDHPNITAILWAGLPGQESGNALVDVLFGAVNPAGRSPFTWGATRESYGTDVLYEPNNGDGAPQDDFTEGVFIDYRYFDKTNATPIYEFGFGLSYTTFEYSNLQVTKVTNASAYVANTGYSAAAPIIGSSNFSTDIADYAFPQGSFDYITAYIYPYLNSTTSLEAASNDSSYGQTAAEFLPPNATSSAPQPLLPASGAPGGNPGLWDVLYTVTADIQNTGSLDGDEVPQLYLSLGGPDDPKVVLRGFDRLTIAAGQTATFTVQLTRRDLSNWDTVSQDWVISSYPKTVYVGRSSRKLDLSASLS
ncbi:family 3 glycoside hydrolase [Cryphonectria parasitica EP155]|uniref:Beta-glucosidase cel3A n=1 Tax=Cryphonectria parasitica (strain ATCC 38755 / EP155) TaxID=660469 RepID=A0A9P4Y9Z9_CRYP1|nr:family 3 glycoside hydrolase [Cryphonectria parasitica EP155]KAF3769516.1 family 3 glycoside hydrolase [Cryphonectria parasitica EP155]